jgi:hypothetical protein
MFQLINSINCCRRQHTILDMKYCLPAFTCAQSLWPSYVQSIEISICVFSVCLSVCMYVCKDVVIPGGKLRLQEVF